MELSLIFRGIIIGFAIAAPVGPIGLLCIKRSLNHGFKSGFVSGLGAATADATYGTIAALGLTAVSSLLINYKVTLQIIGLLFLIYLGVRTFLEKPAEQAATTKGKASDYFSTLFLTLTNPITIISFGAILAGLGLGTHGNNAYSGISLVGGIFLGSALWWLILSSAVGLFRKRLNDKVVNYINKLAGIIILLFAIKIAIDLIW